MVRSEALFVNLQRPAHQRLGLGQAVRVLQQLGQVVEADCDFGMVRSEALFVNRERATIKPFSGNETSDCLFKQPEVIHQPAGRFGNLSLVRWPNDGFHMRRSRLPPCPGPDVVRWRVARQECIPQLRGCQHPFFLLLIRLLLTGHILHQPMQREVVVGLIPLHERVLLQRRQGLFEVGRWIGGDQRCEDLLCLLGGKNLARDWLGGEPGQNLE